MGPVDWIGVVAAALAATAVLLTFRRRGSPLHIAGIFAAMLISSAMLGHALARIGPEKLAVKWWLYFMQSGGLAIAFVIPALWVSLTRHGVGKAVARDAGMWLLAYLAMGLAFYLV
ncbi:DUF1761 domain-containing protein [Novosphingobium sp.]|uniref:DUF1761 domain-containing protein n=1 Tax=Novosphingobium sp. TaxID=1874826 RepID=UPI0035B1AF50